MSCCGVWRAGSSRRVTWRVIMSWIDGSQVMHLFLLVSMFERFRLQRKLLHGAHRLVRHRWLGGVAGGAARFVMCAHVVHVWRPKANRHQTGVRFRCNVVNDVARIGGREREDLKKVTIHQDMCGRRCRHTDHFLCRTTQGFEEITNTSRCRDL